MENIVNSLAAIIWSPALVALCLVAGLLFSIRSRFAQLRLLPEMLRLIFQKKEGEIGLSSFEALSVTLAGRVGIGNIAGVATAIYLGGPGSVFWMWAMAFLGASSAFVESTLGQIYKENLDGEYRGGPAFYIERGLRRPAFAWLFASVAIFAALISFPTVQSNAVALAWEKAFGLAPAVSSAVITTLVCCVIMGGLSRIAKVSTWIVPFMAQAYIIVSLIIVGLNWEAVPATLLLIVESAFGLDSLTGGMMGAAIAWGVRRGIYSNEAGQGSGPHASSAAAVSHPVKQGLVQAFSVYIDTLLVCTATALMILMTDSFNVLGPEGKLIVERLPGVEAGPVYTQLAIDQWMPGLGSGFVAVTIFFFAFTSLLNFYYNAETNVTYLNRYLRRPIRLSVCKFIMLAATAYGAVKSSTLMWTLGDIGVGLMSWVNIIAIILLQKPAFIALRDYEEQLAEGKEPVFHPEKLGIPHTAYWTGNRAEENLTKEKTEGFDPLAEIEKNLPERRF